MPAPFSTTNGEKRYPVGSTTIWGFCEWVGDNPPRAKIRVVIPAKSGDLVVELDGSMLGTIKKYLHQEVCINGVAQWNPVTWKIEKFKATRLSAPPSRNYTEGLQAIADAVGDILQGRTPEELVREWRGEEDD